MIEKLILNQRCRKNELLRINDITFIVRSCRKHKEGWLVGLEILRGME